MDWMQFVAALTSSLAWPIAAIVVLLSFKHHITGLLPKIRSLKYGDLQIDLEEQLKAVQADLTTKASDSDAPMAPPMSSIAAQLAATAPRAAILHSWFEVESALNLLIARLGMQFAAKYDRPNYKMQILLGKGIIDDLTYSTFVRLTKVRNDAAHLTDRQLDTDDALSMSASCAWLIERLQAATPPAHESNEDFADVL